MGQFSKGSRKHRGSSPERQVIFPGKEQESRLTEDANKVEGIDRDRQGSLRGRPLLP